MSQNFVDMEMPHRFHKGRPWGNGGHDGDVIVLEKHRI
jgi:hypothetical protein